MEYLASSVTEYVCTEVPKLMRPTKRRRGGNQPTTLPISPELTVLQTLRELIQAAEKMSLPQVCLRHGISSNPTTLLLHANISLLLLEVDIDANGCLCGRQ